MVMTTEKCELQQQTQQNQKLSQRKSLSPSVFAQQGICLTQILPSVGVA